MKARNALIYPAFILLAFMGVLILMMVFVIPRLAAIFEETGQPLPFYTQAILFLSLFLRKWGIFVAFFFAVGLFLAWRWSGTAEGKIFFHRMQIKIPLIGGLYRKLFMARLTDNLRTLDRSACRSDAHFVHNIQNTAMDRFKAIAHIR